MKELLQVLQEKILLYKICKNKDTNAYAELYDLYVKRIYRFVYFKVSSHETAEDITSEVFLKAWQHLITVAQSEKEGIRSFSGFLYRIARNSIIDFYRKNSAKPEMRIDSEEEINITDAGKWYGDMANNIEAERILKAIKKLKQEYQEVLTLKYVDELSVGEIAEITNKGNIAVRVTLHRALKKLKDILE